MSDYPHWRNEDPEIEEPLSVQCACCDVIAFEPKACAVCGPFTDKLCSDCRKECKECGESVCYDHFDEKRNVCTACEYARYVESGEAKRDYLYWGRDDS